MLKFKMFMLFIITIIFLFSAGCYKAQDKQKNVKIQSWGNLDREKKEQSFIINNKKPADTVMLWEWESTKNGCKCLVRNSSDTDKFKFICSIPNRYEVAVTVNCNLHNNKSNSLELFVCHNFNIWCEQADL